MFNTTVMYRLGSCSRNSRVCFSPWLPLWMRFIYWHIPTSLFLWVSQINLTGRRLKFYENLYLHKGGSSTFLLPSRVGSTVWARRWWIALTCGPEATACPCLAGVGRGGGQEDAEQAGNSLQHWPRFASTENLGAPTYSWASQEIIVD